MHSAICQFSSQTFYQSNIENGVTDHQRTCPELRNFWVNDIPIMFCHNRCRERFDRIENSYWNHGECVTISHIVKNLEKRGIPSNRVCIFKI